MVTSIGKHHLFVAVEPKVGQRIVWLTGHCGKSDFVAFIRKLLTGVYDNARRINLVLDNLSTHLT